MATEAYQHHLPQQRNMGIRGYHACRRIPEICLDSKLHERHFLCIDHIDLAHGGQLKFDLNTTSSQASIGKSYQAKIQKFSALLFLRHYVTLK